MKAHLAQVLESSLTLLALVSLRVVASWVTYSIGCLNWQRHEYREEEHIVTLVSNHLGMSLSLVQVWKELLRYLAIKIILVGVDPSS